MQLLSRKCGICASWYIPKAHHDHCPYCGAYAITMKHRILHFNGVSMRRMASVSPKMLPSGLWAR